MRHLLSIMVERNGHKTELAEDGAQALEMAINNSYDLIITDIKMPRMDGLTLLDQVRKKDLAIPVIIITAFATIESAVEVMRKGAVDYITKPFEEDRILISIERAMKLSKVLKENKELKSVIAREANENEIVYNSDAMAAVIDLANRVSSSDTAVLITGESGTGKEMLAKYIHIKSPRSRERFVPVNCAAISAGLVESELFGHERGAFTSADKKKIGKFEYAAGGTLFLDEIGDLPLEAQAKFLRALQEKKIHRVGGNEEIAVDVRVLCATNQDLEALVANGAFRQDLYYRINVFPIHTPPLRERKRDLIPLAYHFLKKLSGGEDHPPMTKAAETLLAEYDWPGNVRELSNAIERCLILAEGTEKIDNNMFSFLKKQNPNGVGADKLVLPTEGVSLETLEKELVRQALDASGNNQTAAARLLGLSRAKFRVLMKQLK
jgi:DNA-binding NtrC family response regulator